MTTDSILRTYSVMTTTSLVPFPTDTSLLASETSGLAIDFTNTTYYDSITSLQTWNQVRTAGVDSFTSPHTFYTNTGTSPKVVKISSTTLGWSPHNMFLNSGAPATQNVTLVVGYTYTYGITGTGTLTGSAGASGAATAGSPVTFTATTTTGTFTVSGGPSTMQVNRGIVLTTYLATVGSIVIGLPISYAEGLWVEPAATNLVIQSQALSTQTAARATAVESQVAPDGSTTATLITETVGTGTHQLNGTNPTITSATTYTVSFYAKNVDRQFVYINCYGSTNNWFAAVFDLVNGTVTDTAVGAGTGTIVATSMTAIGNGFYRCSASGSHTGANPSVQIELCNTATPVQTVDGDPPNYASEGKSIIVWGLQVELGSVATSYVPTVTASATRATDVPNVATSAYPHSNSAGTFIAWIAKKLINSATGDAILVVNDGTANNRIALDVVTSDNPDSIGLDIVNGGVAQVVSTTTKTGSIALAGNKLAAFYTANDSGVLADAGSEVTDVTCTMPTVTNLQLGYAQDTASRELNGFIRRLIYVPRRMTQAEMQSKTT